MIGEMKDYQSTPAELLNQDNCVFQEFVVRSHASNFQEGMKVFGSLRCTNSLAWKDCLIHLANDPIPGNTL
jgi:hypothetical protein